MPLESIPRITPPTQMGSYRPEDVTFLLKDISDVSLEVGTKDREEQIQNGKHYSEMLPIEYQPSTEYLQLYHHMLKQNAEKVALAVGVVSEQIYQRKGRQVVLASLARAGTPIGILIKRYLEQRYHFHVPHYSISIIRGKGIDENALLYMLQEHPEANIQFVDGWTGKGAITQVLQEACSHFEKKYHVSLDHRLAVLADPGQCVDLFGTREDFLIPSACLNSTVSGLMSRTVLREDIIGPSDFHGAKYYSHLIGEDLSQNFVDTISHFFNTVLSEVDIVLANLKREKHEVTWAGFKAIKSIQDMYEIHDINLVKPGIGETTRVLLRRVPWKILVDRLDNPHLKHIYLLAQDRKVPIEVFPHLTYSCCGIIQSQRGETS